MKINSFFILSLGFVLSSCSKDSKDITTKAKEAYSEGLRTSFVKNAVEECVKTSGEDAREICECSINKLNDTLTDDEIVAFATNNEPKDMEQRMDKAIEECLEGK